MLCVMGPDKMMINLELYSSQRKVPPGGFFCLWWGGGGREVGAKFLTSLFHWAPIH